MLSRLRFGWSVGGEKVSDCLGVALARDSELILDAGLTVTEAVATLNAGMHWKQDRCYVYSEWKKKWYRMWCEKHRWSLKQTAEDCVVDSSMVFDATGGVPEAVDMLNAMGNAWVDEVCYVYTSPQKQWFKLWV